MTLRKVGRAFIRALVIVGTAVGVLSLLSYVFYPKNNQDGFGMIDSSANSIMGERSQSIDALFIGDSEAYSSFSPLQMWNERGFTSYVSATSAQRLIYGKTLLERALEKQRPKVVVIETNSLYAGFSREDAAFRDLQNLFPVFEYHNRWKTLGVRDVSQPIAATWTDSLKGFQVFTSVASAESSDSMKPTNKVEEVPELSRQCLEEIVALCKEASATPVLVSTPSAVNWNMPRHNAVQQLAQSLGIDYFDLNTGKDKVAIDWSADTRDRGDHLNYRGAVKVSGYVGGLLSSRYGLLDHRKDASYSSWNDEYERYRKFVECAQTA